nr:DUF4251 domain-containing protein [uncultured Allomuricauda sp.]
MKKQITLVLVALFTFGSILGQKKSEQNQKKEDVADAQYTKIKQLILSKAYYFEANRVSPIGFGTIDLTGNSNYLKIFNDSVDVYLPYFGVRYTAVGLGESGGIEFTELIEDYTVRYNDDKKRISIDLKAIHQGESFDIQLIIYKNGSTWVMVRSSSRRGIGYWGNIQMDEQGPL